MNEEVKIKKRKNNLVIVLMVLLVAFVCLMCYIVIYAKQNPPIEFVSQDDIEVKQISTLDYPKLTSINHTVIENSSMFVVSEENEDLELRLNENGEVILLRDGNEESIELMQDENNINQNIKIIYQKENEGIFLTEEGILYRLLDNEINDGQLQVGEILTETKIKDVVSLGLRNSYIYVINEEDKIVNVNNQKEYIGVIEEIQTNTSTIYIYANGGFGLEEGKVFVDENGNVIEISLSFDNKIIGRNNIIYEINSIDNTLSTSKLGVFSKVGYRKNDNEETYKVNLLANTGSYDFISNYYYSI